MDTGLKDPLRLIALDTDDLSVLSAHLQDAAAKVSDMAFLPDENRFAMLVDRFDWVTAVTSGPAQRRRSGLHFDRVQRARTRGFDLKDRDTVLNLLAAEFEERDAPSGTITLYFTGEAAIQLDVECLEAAISDLGPVWPADKRPQSEG